jgi:hypothetical protein
MSAFQAHRCCSPSAAQRVWIPGFFSSVSKNGANHCLFAGHFRPQSGFDLDVDPDELRTGALGARGDPDTAVPCTTVTLPPVMGLHPWTARPWRC